MKSLKLTIISLLFFTFVLVIVFLNAGPPKPTVLAEGQKITVIEGSYCWKKIMGVECVDKISPSEIIANNKIAPMYVSPQSKIKINFKKKPTDGIAVEEWMNASETKTVKIEGNVFSAPSQKGTYIYIVSGKWDKGSASYIFSLKVK